MRFGDRNAERQLGSFVGVLFAAYGSSMEGSLPFEFGGLLPNWARDLTADLVSLAFHTRSS